MPKKASAASGKVRSRSEVYGALAEAGELTRKQVSCLFEELSALIKADLSKKGPGIFKVSDLMKIKVIQKPATKAREGINPFTKERMMFKAKPARKVVKVLPLKGLKDLV